MYTYEALAVPDAEIRVAILQPASSYSNDLHIHFSRRVLDEPSPAYEALSYVWGVGGSASSVRISKNGANKGQIDITHNLDVALRHLRYTDKERAIYIDALCIDQQDKTQDGEKSKQVAIMGEIYRLSRQTVVWLGPKENDSDAAFTLLRYFASQLRSNHEAQTLHPTEQCTNHSLADVRISLPYKSGELSCIDYLFSRPYFGRTWTRQEVTLAREAVVKCGAQEMPWADFVQGVETFQYKQHQRGALDETLQREYHFKRVATRAYDLCRLKDLRLEYSFLRPVFRDTDCSDKRDKIYAVMSLVPDLDRRLGVKPDYSLSVEEVYTDLAKRIVKDHRLRLLESCELSSDPDRLKLPTWVPDWSTPSNFERFVTANYWSACSWITHEATVTKDNILNVAGIEVAQVQHTLDYALDRWECENADVLLFLRALGDVQHVKDSVRRNGIEAIRMYCKALVGEQQFSQSYLPPHPDKPDFQMSVQFLTILWMEPGAIEITPEMFSPTGAFMRNQLLAVNYIHRNLTGKTLFTTAAGHVGVAPVGTQAGDMVFVILGCDLPLVLRPVSSPEAASWQVVGACYVHGFMAGEAIYRGRLPSSFKPILLLQRDEASGRDQYHRYSAAMYDAESQTTKKSPVEILTDMGIGVEKYVREPHFAVVVKLASLRDAGIPVQILSLA